MDRSAFEDLPRFRWADIKEHVEGQKPFEAISPMGTAILRVQSYEPLMGLASHAGHRVREELLMKMDIEEEDRFYEEDPFVEEFIADFPMQMIALDSRYEYDLNRKREQCIYLKPMESWGKRIWLQPPSKEDIELSQQKHEEFHELLDYFIETSIERSQRALVFDVHSYNWKRQKFSNQNKNFPLFNLALAESDYKNFGDSISQIVGELKKVTLANIETTVAENDVFIKDGAIALGLMEQHKNVLVLPLEVKKVFMDELTGSSNLEMIKQFRSIFSDIGKIMLQEFTKKS